MDSRIVSKATAYREQRKKLKRWQRFVALLSAVVLFATTYALRMPADTKETKTYCGKVQHEHSAADGCYAETRALVCDFPENHVHTEECYGIQSVLACGMQESDGHAHTDNCRQETKTLSCAIEETDGHVHGDACYETIRTLICQDPEHAHTDGCYSEEIKLICNIEEKSAHHHGEGCYTSAQELVCGLEEQPQHVHDAACYAEESVLNCQIPEGHVHTEECYVTEQTRVCKKSTHVHTLQCYSDPYADLEGPAVWKRTTENAKLTGNWSEDVIAVAMTQLGYKESTRNYKVLDDGITKSGYTRYGDWAGSPYADWCAMFCAFCVRYAEIPEDAMPTSGGSQLWIEKLEPWGLYREKEDYTPKAGDLIFFNHNKQNYGSDHVGLVYAVDAKKVYTIEGNKSEAVRKDSYKLDDEDILGYGVMPQNPDYVENAEAIAAPEVEIASEPTVAPEVATVSEPTVAPEVATVSEPTAAPEVATVSEPTAAPEVATASEPTVAPEVATVSEPTAAPEVATASEPTAAPEVATASEPTAAPEVATASEPTEAPVTPSEPEAATPSEPEIIGEFVYHCGLEEHTHDENCYNEAGELVCMLAEHTHTDACLAIPENENTKSSDVEDQSPVDNPNADVHVFIADPEPSAWMGIVYGEDTGMPIPCLFQGDYPSIVCYVSGQPKSVATSGCGAASLSMVIAYLNGDTEQNPYTLFRSAVENGRYYGSGLSHETLTWLADAHGVQSKWIENDADAILNALNSGRPVIAHMGAGFFTNAGHYIVLRGVTEDGMILVNDPASEERCDEAFPLEMIIAQARTDCAFMVCSANAAETFDEAADEGFFCGKEWHMHDDSCYDSDGSLICGMEEHIHTFACWVELSAERNGVYVTLSAEYSGDEEYSWSWQYSEDGSEWTDIENADGLEYTFVAIAEDLQRYYRVVAEDIEDPADTKPRLLLAKAAVSEMPRNVSDGVMLNTMVSGLSSDGVLIVAGSDFQDPKVKSSSQDFTDQNNRLKAIMTNIFTGYEMNATAFFGGGDYNFDEIKSNKSLTEKGIQQVENSVTAVFGDDYSSVFVQGNHDSHSAGSLSGTGAHDTADYGVYVVDENEYRSYPQRSDKWSDWQNSGTIAQSAAADLGSYLSVKANAGYSKPVFVLFHVPLHFSTRTVKESDAIYAKYFVDVLNTYGNDLNIIVLCGHNHAWGDDDYLGGSSYFFDYGDTINVAALGDNSASNMTATTIKFTYMNYGYTGYYWGNWNSHVAGTADSTLTMSSFMVIGNTVQIARWDEDGVHVLKHAGHASAGGRGVSECCPVTSNSVGSPQTVYLHANPGSDEPELTELTDEPTGIRVEGYGSGLEVEAVVTVPALEELGAEYSAFGISMSQTENTSATVYIPADEDDIIWRITEDGAIVIVAVYADGYASFETETVSGLYAVGTITEEPGDPVEPGTGYYWVKADETGDITYGDTYLIVAHGTSKVFGAIDNGSETAANGENPAVGTVALSAAVTVGDTVYYTAEGAAQNFCWIFTDDGRLQNAGYTQKYLRLTEWDAPKCIYSGRDDLVSTELQADGTWYLQRNSVSSSTAGSVYYLNYTGAQDYGFEIIKANTGNAAMDIYKLVYLRVAENFADTETGVKAYAAADDLTVTAPELDETVMNGTADAYSAYSVELDGLSGTAEIRLPLNTEAGYDTVWQLTLTEENVPVLTETEFATGEDGMAVVTTGDARSVWIVGRKTAENGGLFLVPGDTGILTDWDGLFYAVLITEGEDYENVSAQMDEGYVFKLYDICKSDGAIVPEEGVKVYLPVTGAKTLFGFEDGAIVLHEDAELVTVDGKSYMCFTAYHFSLYGTAGLGSDFVLPEFAEPETVKGYDEATSLSDGDQVIILNTKCNHYLSDKSTGNNGKNVLKLENVSKDEATVWTVVVSNDKTYLRNSEGKYLAVGNGSASLSDSPAASAEYVSDNSCWQLRQRSGYTNYYLNDYGNSGNIAAGYNQGAGSNDGSRWRIYKATEYVPDYWVRCNSTSDFTTDGIYMIVRGDVSFALGTVNNNGAVAEIAEHGTVDGRTSYRIIGAGSGEAHQWTFSSISNGKYTLRNVGTTNKYLRLTANPILAENASSANTITNPGTDPEAWQIKNGSYYLYYDTGSKNFNRHNSDGNSYLYIYKKAEPTASQLAVQKLVPEFNTNVDVDTEFTFRIVKADSDSISAAAPISGGYTLYDYKGAQIGTGTLNNGELTLKAGQTALFNNPDVTGYYFVEEAVSADISSVTATVNDTGAEVAQTSDGSYKYVPVTFSDENNSLVRITNTPRYVAPCLTISLGLDSENEFVNGDSTFEFLVTDDDGVPAEFTGYVIDDGELAAYDAADPRIPLKPGETVRIYGLDDGSSGEGGSDAGVLYAVHQYYGEKAMYINHTTAAVNGEDVQMTDIERENSECYEREESYFTVDYTGFVSANVTNCLRSISSGSGTAVPELTPKVPDHHKYIDAFRDGEDNPDTDLDDRARGEIEGESVTDAVIEDLYRLYLDVGPESAYEAVDVMFIVDSSTSMSGYTGYDAYDILGNDSWRCFALDTLLLGQGNERSAGSDASFNGSGTQNTNQHQRTMYDNGLIKRIANMNPNNKVAVARFSGTSEVLLDWTLAKNVTGIKSYTNQSGTNYVAAMQEIIEFLNAESVKNDGNKKIAVFISDGLPTKWYSTVSAVSSGTDNKQYASLGGTYVVGSGTETQNDYDATELVIEEFNQDSFITGLEESGELEIYTVAVGSGVFREINNTGDTIDARLLLKMLATDGTCIDSTNFKTILQILDMKITDGYGHYSNLKITDTLSDYVDFYTADLDMLIEKIPVDDEEATVVLYKNGALTEAGATHLKPLDEGGVTVDTDKKTVTVEFLDSYIEEGDYTYRISFNIETTQEAYDEYADNVEDGRDGYNGVKGAGTSENRKTDYTDNGNYTSSGLSGFHSNKKAVLEYTQSRIGDQSSETRSVEYPHPVVQVWTADLDISKIWADGAELHTDDSVTIDVWMKALPEEFDPDAALPDDVRTDGTKIRTVTLNAANEWTETVEGLPRGYYYYITEQTDDDSEYVQVYEPYAAAVPHNMHGTMNFSVGVTNQKVEPDRIVLKKTDMAQNPIPGAEFELYSDETHTTQVYASELICSGDDGIFTAEEFAPEYGTYYLVETVVPDGYNGLTAHVELTYTADGLTAYYNGTPLKVVTDTTADGLTVYTLAIQNSNGYELPETGGSGTTLYYTLGVLLMAGALMYGFSTRRKKRGGAME